MQIYGKSKIYGKSQGHIWRDRRKSWTYKKIWYLE